MLSGILQKRVEYFGSSQLCLYFRNVVKVNINSNVWRYAQLHRLLRDKHTILYLHLLKPHNITFAINVNGVKEP